MNRWLRWVSICAAILSLNAGAVGIWWNTLDERETSRKQTEILNEIRLVQEDILGRQDRILDGLRRHTDSSETDFDELSSTLTWLAFELGRASDERE